MATALGQRCIARYIANDITYAELQKALALKWITQDEFDATTAEYPSPPHD